MKKPFLVAFVFSFLFLACSGPSSKDIIDVDALKEQQKTDEQIAKKRHKFDSGTTEVTNNENK